MTGQSNEKTRFFFGSSLAYSYLWPAAVGTFARKTQRKITIFLWFFARLFVPLHPIMTPQEYVQLKAFARQDGALLSLLWLAAFICYVQGLTNPLLGMLALGFMAYSPFYAASRLRHFRNYAREGIISFARGYAYYVLTFFYAGLLLAVAMYVYFAFIDSGHLMATFTEVLNSKEHRQLLDAYGMTEQVAQSLKEMASLRPIDYALNMLTINISAGFLLGLPFAAIMQRQAVKS